MGDKQENNRIKICETSCVHYGMYGEDRCDAGLRPISPPLGRACFYQMQKQNQSSQRVERYRGDNQ